MKVLKVIKNIVVGILLVAFFAFAIAMTVLLLNRNKFGVTEFEKTTMIMVNDEISSDNYKKRDLVLVEKRKLEKIEIGDEIFVYKTEKNGGVSIDVGLVGEVYLDDDAVAFENGATYSSEYIVGEASKIYPDIGGYLSIILSKWGFLFIILVPSLMIFIYELYAIVVEVKYGKETN